MIIQHRLTLQFIAIVAVIFGIVLGTVYYTIKINTEHDFYKRLEERAFVAAYKFLEEDESSKDRIDLFERRYLQHLPGEIIQVLDDKNAYTFIEKDTSLSFSHNLLLKIRQDTIIRYAENDRQIVGIYYRDNQGNFIIVASAVDVQGKIKTGELRAILLLSFAGGLFFIFIGGRIFAKRALIPMNAIVHRVRTITASNLHLRVEIKDGNDEIGRLATTFNTMLERLEHSFVMQQSFINNASHELRTPMTAIIGEIEVLLTKKRTNSEYKKTLEDILAEAEQINEFSNSLLDLAQTSIVEKRELVDLIRIDELLWEIREEMMKRNSKTNIIISFHELPDDSTNLIVRGNKHLLTAACSNIIDNAVKFSHNKPVYCSLTVLNDSIIISIADTGIGISTHDLKNLFAPFYRGENARAFNGHGIGLALSEKIIHIHAGTIEVESTIGAGTRFAITLPGARAV